MDVNAIRGIYIVHSRNKIHTKSKAETYTVEGYNSILRHFLARLRLEGTEGR
jgi:IS1 family transposase